MEFPVMEVGAEDHPNEMPIVSELGRRRSLSDRKYLLPRPMFLGSTEGGFVPTPNSNSNSNFKMVKKLGPLMGTRWQGGLLVLFFDNLQNWDRLLR